MAEVDVFLLCHIKFAEAPDWQPQILPNEQVQEEYNHCHANGFCDLTVI